MEKNILKLAKDHHLEIEGSSLEFVNMGLDFQVVFGTDKNGIEWVLRIPRRKDVFEKVRIEKNILDLVNELDSEFQVPNWEKFTEELIAYKKLEGQPAVTTDIETQEQHWIFDTKRVPKNYIHSLGKALATLHRVPKDKAKAMGLSVQSAAELRTSMKERMDIVNNRYKVNKSLWERWQKWLEDEEMWPKETGFIHGDLFPGHTLVDEQFTITGIIDWTEAKVGDVSNDFTAFYMLFGESKLEELISAYDKAGGYTWPKMKQHIIELLSTQGITIAEFAMTSGLEEYDQMARQILNSDKS